MLRRSKMASDSRLENARRLYADLLMAESGSDDQRLRQAFSEIRREDFLPKGPWKIVARRNRYVKTPDADPIHLYRNALIALDAGRRLNTGQPALHAAWIGALAPQPGETVSHIGAGMGYYTAILARLVSPGGHVFAFEIEPSFAKAARHNLQYFDNVELMEGDAVTGKLPKSDIVYVNAGLAAPPVSWLEALKETGRMIFPWQPSLTVGIGLRVTRAVGGYRADPLMPVGFIACTNALQASDCKKPPTPASAGRVRSIRLVSEKPPDDTAIAVFDAIWFSSEAL